MDKYKQQQQHESDFRRRMPVDEGRRMKMRMEKETTDNDRSGTNYKFTSSSLCKQPEPHGGIGGSRGRFLRPGFDPLTNDNLLHKTSARAPNLPPQRSVNEKKVVNWRLACFMCNEYLNRGTLLGSPWPPQDSNPNCHENAPQDSKPNRYEDTDKSEPKSGSRDQDRDESRRDKERLYRTLAEFLRAGDVHLPGIVNPSQLAAWLWLN